MPSVSVIYIFAFSHLPLFECTLLALSAFYNFKHLAILKAFAFAVTVSWLGDIAVGTWFFEMKMK